MSITKLSARAIAAQVLQNLDLKKHDTASRLDKLMDKTDQRARATDLVYGIIRNLSAIDCVLHKTAKIRMEHTHKTILALLQIGVYELVYVADTPEYAIINEAAESASMISRKSSGFVNAVLRNVQRAIQNRKAPLAGQNTRKILPIDEFYGCLFVEEILPEPGIDLGAFFSEAFSLPAWLVRQWLMELGPEKTKSICFASNRHPSVILRPNVLKISSDDLTARLREEHLEISVSSDNSCMKILNSVDISTLNSFQKGLFIIQDQAAYDAVSLLPVEKGWTILDLCAAPGTKTAILAGKMQNTGKIYATDADERRLFKVEQNCNRLGIKNIEIIKANNLDNLVSQNISFDAILADVPCSNTGVLARRVEARWRLQKSDIQRITSIQTAILRKAFSLIRPGGHIVYSTCSILRDENEDLIRGLLSDYPQMKVLKENCILPEVQNPTLFDHDGGYSALIQSPK